MTTCITSFDIHLWLSGQMA